MFQLTSLDPSVVKLVREHFNLPDETIEQLQQRLEAAGQLKEAEKYVSYLSRFGDNDGSDVEFLD